MKPTRFSATLVPVRVLLKYFRPRNHSYSIANLCCFRTHPHLQSSKSEPSWPFAIRGIMRRIGVAVTCRICQLSSTIHLTTIQ